MGFEFAFLLLLSIIYIERNWVRFDLHVPCWPDVQSPSKSLSFRTAVTLNELPFYSHSLQFGTTCLYFYLRQYRHIVLFGRLCHCCPSFFVFFSLSFFSSLLRCQGTVAAFCFRSSAFFLYLLLGLLAYLLVVVPVSILWSTILFSLSNWTSEFHLSGCLCWKEGSGKFASMVWICRTLLNGHGPKRRRYEPCSKNSKKK